MFFFWLSCVTCRATEPSFPSTFMPGVFASDLSDNFVLERDIMDLFFVAFGRGILAFSHGCIWLRRFTVFAAVFSLR